jgi:lysozyme
MASYIGIMGRTGKVNSVQALSTEQLTQKSAAYLKEVDALAKITGQSRAQKQAEFEDLSRDAQFAAATMNMEEDKQRELMAFINSFPASARGAVKDMVSTGSVTTEAAKQYAALNSKSAQQIMSFGSQIRRGNTVTKESYDQAHKDAILEARSKRAQNAQLAAFGTEYSETVQSLNLLSRMDIDGKEKALTEQEKVAKQTEELATNIGTLKQDIAQTSNKFTVELLDDTAIASLRMAFTSMGEFVNAFVLPIFKLTVAVISPFVTLIGGIVKIISKTLGPIFNTLADAIRGVTNLFNDAVGPMLDWFAENSAVLTALVSTFIVAKLAVHAYSAGMFLATAAKKAYTLALALATKGQMASGVASTFLQGRFKEIGQVVMSVGGTLMTFAKSAIVVAKGFATSGAVLAVFGKIAAGFMTALAFVGKGIALAGAIIASPAIAIGAAIAAAAAAVYLVVKYWDNIVGFISNIGTKLKNAFFGVLDSIKATAKKLNPLNWFSDDDEETSQAPNESSAETARLSRQNDEISPEMQRSLKLSDMWGEGEDNSEAIEVGEKQLAASRLLAIQMAKLDQSNKVLNETLVESNELNEEEKEEEKSSSAGRPTAAGRPTSATPSSQSSNTATSGNGGSSGRAAARDGSISDRIPAAGAAPSSDSSNSGGSKNAPSASGGKDGPSAGKQSSGGRDGGADGAGGGGGGGAKPQSTGRPTGKGGTMSEEDTKAMIIEHEGIRYEPYKDSLGLWTVGVGHLIGDGKTLPPEYNRKFSHEEVMAMFEKDYDKHKKQAQSNVPGFGKYDSLGQAALVDLTFNMGPGWPRKFKNTSAKLAAGDTAGAADGLTNSKWYTQVGRRAPIITGMIRESKVSAAEGGVFNGPKSGYPATLHGEEAVVPLKGGNIPVEMGGNASQTEMINLLSSLNSKMEHLVALNSAIADLNSSQLKAQKKMGNTELLV